MSKRIGLTGALTESEASGIPPMFPPSFHVQPRRGLGGGGQETQRTSTPDLKFKISPPKLSDSPHRERKLLKFLLNGCHKLLMRVKPHFITFFSLPNGKRWA